ncbi:DUF2948 family protein [Marinivivus vitaminiproducens]|uniref:DUF2948 family protein n=1 Tax=Marinivivus vitaminiproducens TaxID=3035935 RepID=UPI00279F8F46|nr:DUF2948 family protein [Geminicoccaceae bacterium SCSIO 64248]
MTKPDRLRLRAEDLDDLMVIAAVLQDARITLREMVYARDEKRFMAAFNRYRRETLDDIECKDGWTRCQTALVIGAVESVQWRGIDTSDLDRELQIFTMLGLSAEEGYELMLIFTDEGAIRLNLGDISVQLQDFGECECCNPPEPIVDVQPATSDG